MRLLFLSVSAGAGHVRAAEALASAAKRMHPDAVVENRDVLDFTAKGYRKAYAGSFLALVDRAPALWGYLYEASDRRGPSKEEGIRKKLVQLFDKLEFDAFRRFVRGFAPDVVVSTHFLPCQVFAPSRRRGRDAFPLHVVVTDFDVHAFWAQPTADLVHVATEELKAILASRGIDATRIAVSGIPIAEGFGAAREKGAARTALGLAPSLPTALVMSGGAGVGAMEETVSALLDGPPVQLLAVAGRNEALKASLEKLRVPPGSALRAYGFVTNVEELMAAADLAVTKSGGLTTAECLARGLPMLVRDPIPGQEERNADFLLEAGAGLKAHGLASLRFKAHALLADPPRLARMSAAARSAARPRAAEAIVRKAVAAATVRAAEPRPG